MAPTLASGAHLGSVPMSLMLEKAMQKPSAPKCSIHDLRLLRKLCSHKDSEECDQEGHPAAARTEWSLL